MCLVCVAILTTMLETMFLIGKFHGTITKPGARLRSIFRTFDFTFKTEERLPACLSLKDVFVKLFLIPAICIVIGLRSSMYV